MINYYESPGETPSDDDLDVEGPNESAPGHNPEDAEPEGSGG